MTDVAAVIVHHKRHDAIGGVVRSLVEAGLRPEHIVVVDNSDEPEKADALRRDVSPASAYFVENRGYGSAANIGIRRVREQFKAVKYVLVATHEVSIEASALASLCDALTANRHLSAVGPTLIDGESITDATWSTGGAFSPLGRMPVHVKVDAPRERAVVPRRWLDGAVVLYRLSHLGFDPFDESFFLYMEEVDLHLRLGYQGTPVAWVPTAQATQTSSGTPARLFSRNLRLLHSKHRMAALGANTIVPIGRRAAGFAVRKEWNQLKEVGRGAVEALPRNGRHVVVVNPLQMALAHYADAFRDTARAAGVSTTEISFPEPSAAADGRFRWLLRYIRALRRAAALAKRSGGRIVVLWPVLGYLDCLLGVLFAGRVELVMHDPKPLVSARGYGALSTFIARLVSARASLIVHSEAALAEVTSLGFRRVASINHPVMESLSTLHIGGAPVVRVLGQYKTDRDLRMMETVAAASPESWTFEVCGRGWPTVPGWETDARFLEEEEFDMKIRTASAILVPYTRFYQSGVALRALEVGTPVVAPADSVLGPLISPSHRTDEDPWSAVGAIFEAVSNGRESSSEEFLEYRTLGIQQFREHFGMDVNVD